MRNKELNGNLSVQAIAGARVLPLGMGFTGAKIPALAPENRNRE